MSSNDPDSCVPKALTDFVFDLYDSVSTSQIAEEQTKLYVTDFHDLNAKYFGSSSAQGGGGGGASGTSAATAGAASGSSSSPSVTSFWPSPQAIAGECNGDPLFLALYRELTHRQWHAAVSRPTLRDRCEGWHVYRELFEEILELENFFVVPQWCFDILNEFVYQFQGFCQVRSAVYASAKKHGLMAGDGGGAGAGATSTAPGEGDAATTPTSAPAPPAALLENWNALQPGAVAADAWDVEAVFGYLNKLVQIGNPSAAGSKDRPVAYKYLSVFAAVALSRLECLLGDYSACLRAIQPTLMTEGASAIVEGDKTVKDVLHSVLSARVSVAYHCGVSYLMLRRYKDAIATLADMCAGFPHLVAMAASAAGGSGVVVNSRSSYHHHRDNKQDNNSVAAQLQSQLMKQYDRMVSLLVVLTQLTPNSLMAIGDDATRRAVRDKLSRGESSAASGAAGPGGGASSSLEEYFASPKFISVNGGAATTSGPMVPFHRHQTNLFLREAQLQNPYKTLRSYLKLYTSLPLSKLATFYDQTVEQVLPLLLSYKTKMRQLETSSRGGGGGGRPVGAESSTTSTEATAASDAGALATTASSYKTAMDIHYYVVDSMCHIDEPEKQRRFETHFFRQIAHASGIARQAAALDVRL